MALGPTVRESLEATQPERLAEAERKIDRAIRARDRAESPAQVRVPTDGLGIAKMEWRLFLEGKYQAAGWRIARWEVDPQDGDYIELIA